MSYVLHVTCQQYQAANNVTMDPPCVIVLESLYKIQFNGHAKNATCHMCYMSCVTNISCKQFYQRPQVLYIFGKLMQNAVQ